MKIVVVCVTALFLTSCFNLNKSTVKIGLNKWPGYDPIYAAKVKGLYKHNNLDVEILEYGSLNDVKVAFERGQIDVMCSTLIEMLKSYDDSKIKSKVLFPSDFSNGPDVIIGKNIKSLRDLKGKKIAVEKGTLGMYILARGLEKAKLKLSDITIVGMDQSRLAKNFSSNDIDAVVSYPPFSIGIMNENSNSKVIFSSKDIPYEVIDVLVVRHDFEKKHPQATAKLKLVWDQVLKLLKTDRAAMIKIMAQRERISTKEFEEVMSGLVYLDSEGQNRLYKTDKILLKAIQTTIDVLHALGDLKKKHNPEIFI